MRLQIKQKLLAVFDTFLISDEEGNLKYTAKEIVDLAYTLQVYDEAKRVVGTVAEVIEILGPFDYEISAYGQNMGTVHYSLKGLTPVYRMERMGWYTRGNILEHEYDVLEGDRVVGHISKKRFKLKDTYELEYERPQDEFLLLLLVLAIDAFTRPKED